MSCVCVVLVLLQEAARALKGRLSEALKAAAASHAAVQEMQAQAAAASADSEVPSAPRYSVDWPCSLCPLKLAKGAL